MSDVPRGHGWWQASDGRWYPPEQHPQYRAPVVVYQPDESAKAVRNGCVIALAVVGGLVVLGFVALIALGVLFAANVDDLQVAGRDNGVTITLDEFDEIENGMSLKEVQTIVGGEGALMSTAGSGEFTTEIYSWDGSGSLGANANVSFQNGEVIAKAQFGLD